MHSSAIIMAQGAALRLSCPSGAFYSRTRCLCMLTLKTGLTRCPAAYNLYRLRSLMFLLPAVQVAGPAMPLDLPQ